MTDPITMPLLGAELEPEAAGPSRLEPVRQQVLYRKWRPRRFDELVGQEPVTTTLRNAVRAGAPAHAYLFSGPRGTGKTSAARIMARAVNCPTPQDGEPDNTCATCVAFLAGEPLDLIELDAASNRGIDEVRRLRENAGISPNRARYKVYLIDEVHMLTEPAFNALLKTLEEPPPHVIFVLATTEPHKLPATILSRCQRFDFRRIALDAVAERLGAIARGEYLAVAAGGLELIARQATGSLRDAVSLLDQLAAYHGRELSLDAIRDGLGLAVDARAGALARAAVQRDLAAGLAVLSGARDDGLEIRTFLRQVVDTLRSLLLLKAGGEAQLKLADSELSALRATASGCSANDVVTALRALAEVDFAGDAYDALPAEIAFAALAVGADDAALAVPPPPVPAAQAPRERPRPTPTAREHAQPVAARAPRAPRAPTAPRGPQLRDERRPAAIVPPPDAPEGRGGRTTSRAFLPLSEGEVSPQLAAVRAQWGAIQEAARERHFRAGALLNSPCYIKSFDADTLQIGFRYANLVEMVKTVDDGKVMQAIREVVSEIVGRPIEVQPVLWEALQPSGAAAAATPQGGGHLVDEALKLGARRAQE
ncbi:MAG: DNA polymerase III subunit gamma/tau [Dehalococcoidia bacterium]|nr:DNA polymerase III subunit gamma/tau [Dehalococcoidia bacterium]